MKHLTVSEATIGLFVETKLLTVKEVILRNLGPH